MPGELKNLQDIMTCQRHSRPAAAGPGFWRSVVLQQHQMQRKNYSYQVNGLQGGKFFYGILLPFLLAYFLIKTGLLI